MALHNDIGRALKKLRTERGFTQKELADRVNGGLDYTYIGKIERGEQLPSLRILIGLSEALGVPVGHFFRDEVPVGEARLLMPDTEGKEAELRKELRQLHPDDLPLVIEIIRVLNRHRKAERKKPHYPAEAGELPLAAEDDPSYDNS
ncbi:helix-turn-helix transcriptional regulator [Geobacter sp.]|uniref:helix-turn-helix domain-containing protein n=1 Tax=Geobacter sp. TaxID=46610 RepID=UPI002610D989|nr:helix-turn-helix transcriptional regulator [Geobacter sp.]